MTKEARIEAIKYFIKRAYDTSYLPGNITPAYLQGFRKAAESAGVDQDVLIKIAGGLTFLEQVEAFRNAMNNSARDQFGDGTFFKNLGTGLGRMGTGVLQGVTGLVSGVGGVLSGTAGWLHHGLTGKGWANGWREGWDSGYNNMGFGSYNLGAARRRLASWDQKLRDDYIERNNIDVKNMSMLERLALLGTDIAQGAGEGIGASVAGGVAAKGVGAAAGRVANATSKATSVAGKATNLAARGVKNTAKFVNPNMKIGPKMGIVVSGINGDTAINTGGNYNRQHQDFNNLGNANSQNYYSAVKPGDISDQITYNA